MDHREEVQKIRRRMESALGDRPTHGLIAEAWASLPRELQLDKHYWSFMLPFLFNGSSSFDETRRILEELGLELTHRQDVPFEIRSRARHYEECCSDLSVFVRRDTDKQQSAE